MKLLCSRMSSENSCFQEFSTAPCGGADICQRQLGKPELLERNLGNEVPLVDDEQEV